MLPTSISTQTQYEYRTSRAVAAIFSSQELAINWLNQWKTKNPTYASSLKLVKVTTYTHMEVVR